MPIRCLPGYEFQRQRWKNGLGWTREILRLPADGDDFDCRLSVAEIDHDCDFSAFPGLRRSLVLLQGNGMRLRFADGECHELAPPHGRLDFDGARALHCELLDGPTRDFNLMWNPQRVAASLHHRPIVGSMVFFLHPGSRWMAYVLAGWAADKDHPGHARAQAGDVLLLEADGERNGRLLLDGAGELLLIRLDPPPIPSLPGDAAP